MPGYSKYRITVKAIVVSCGKFLLLRRSIRNGKQKQHLWELPGGGVDAGENPNDALHREVFEEVGLELESAYPVTVWHQKREEGEIVGITYLCRSKENKLVTSDEHTCFEWVTAADLDNFDLIGDLKSELKDLGNRFDFGKISI